MTTNVELQAMMALATAMNQLVKEQRKQTEALVQIARALRGLETMAGVME